MAPAAGIPADSTRRARRRWIRTRAPVASESRPDASGAPDAIAMWRAVAVEGDIATPLPLGCGAASAGATRTSSSTCEFAAATTTTKRKRDGPRTPSGVPAASSSASLPRTGPSPSVASAPSTRAGRGSRRARTRRPKVRLRSSSWWRNPTTRFPPRAPRIRSATAARGVSSRARQSRFRRHFLARARTSSRTVARGAIAARGIASPGEPARVLSADPRQALTLELVPLDDAGEIAGACVGAVSLTAGDFDADARAPKTKEALVELRSRSAEGHAAGANAVARLMVTVERGRAPRRGGGTPPHFGGRSRARSSSPTGVRSTCWPPREVTRSAPGSSPSRPPRARRRPPTFLETRPGRTSTFDGRCGSRRRNRTVRRAVLPARVDVEPGKPPEVVVAASPVGPVDLLVAAKVWAPRGASPAASTPCLRVCVRPALAVVNASSLRVEMTSEGAAPQNLAPGEGPTPALRSPIGGFRTDGDVAVRVSFRLLDVVDDDDAFGSEPNPRSASLSVAALAATAGGAWIALPRRRTGANTEKTATRATLRVTAESAGEGAILLVLRGGDDDAFSSGAPIRVENRARGGDARDRRRRYRRGSTGVSRERRVGPGERVVHDRAGIVDAVGARQTRRVRGVSRGDENDADEKTRIDQTRNGRRGRPRSRSRSRSRSRRGVRARVRGTSSRLVAERRGRDRDGTRGGDPGERGRRRERGGVANREDDDPRSDPF